MKVFGLHNNTGSRFYRLVPQFRELQARGHKVILEPHNTENILEKINWADVVIFEMVLSRELAKYAKDKGKTVLFECDDLLHRVPKGHYAYEETKGWGGLKLLWQFARILRLCDGFIASNKQLSDLYGRWAKSSLVFPNYLDMAHWMRPHRKNTSDRVRILWAGSTSHTPDLQMIKPVLDRILRKYPQVQFIYIGHGGIKSQDLQAKFIYGEDLFDGLPDNRESMLSAPPEVWPHILGGLMADIGIVPLQENYFNKFKTQCKFLEYSVNRIPGVYSKWFYTNVKHGQTGFLAGTDEEWVRQLELLINQDRLRKEIGSNAFQNALQNHDVRLYIDKWVRYVKKIHAITRSKKSNKVKDGD